MRKATGIALVLIGVFGVWSWNLAPKRHLAWTFGDEKAAFEKARAEHKGVMVDFSASWCGPCEELERTFGSDDVYEAITASFVPLKFDVTNGTDEDLERKARYHAETLPAVVFMAPTGTVVGRVDQMIDGDEMLAKLKPAIAALKTGTGVEPCTN